MGSMNTTDPVESDLCHMIPLHCVHCARCDHCVTFLFPRADFIHMATTKAGIGRALKFGIGMIIAGFAIINAVKAVRRAARAVKSAGEK